MSILEVIAPAVAEAERIESGGEVRPNEVAALLRFNADLVVDYATALQEERAYSARCRVEINEMVGRLSRLQDHLSSGGVLLAMIEKLSDYAGSVGYEEVGDPIPDPFPPEPEPAQVKRRRKS